jgi:hypothetical protein
MNSNKSKKDRKTPPPDPVDVVDGIPDRSANAAPWKYIVMGVVFAAWMAVLIFIRIAGQE